MVDNAKTVNISSETDMLRWGKQFSQHLTCPPWVIFLQGTLGAGKTTLVKSILEGLGHQGSVKSPTFTLVEPYLINKQDIFHFDLYRLKAPEELENIGFRDYFSSSAICFIEWPEKAGNFLSAPDIEIKLQVTNETERTLMLSAHSPKGKKLLAKGI